MCPWCYNDPILIQFQVPPPILGVPLGSKWLGFKQTYRVSQKNATMFKTAITPTKLALGIQVGRVLRNPQEVLLLMGTEIFQFWPLGAEKMGFKVGNPMSKSMTKSSFPQAQFVLGILRNKTPFTLEYLSLLHKRNSLKWFKNTIKKYSYGKKKCDPLWLLH